MNRYHKSHSFLKERIHIEIVTRLFIFLIFLFSTTQGFGQSTPPGVPGPMSGPSTAIGGTSSEYTVTAGTNATSFNWTVTAAAGTITNGGGLMVTIAWKSNYTGSATVSCASVNSYGTSAPVTETVSITAPMPLVVGAITPNSQTINYNTPATLTGASPTGGNNTYTYQWQSSASSSGTYNSISGATAQNYTTPNLTAATYYQQVVASGTATATSAIAAVLVYPQLVPGAVTPVSQSVTQGSPLTPLSGTAGTGGNGTITYQWQSSPDNGSNDWTNITGATNTSLALTTATSTIYYRLAVTSNSQTLYSNSSVVLISDCYQLNTSPAAANNYMITSTFRESGITSSITDAQINAMGVCDVNQTIQYLDGLGRPIQTVEAKASPLGADIVQPIAYDPYGREVLKYQPYTVPAASSNGSYQSTAITDQKAYYTSPPTGVFANNSPYAGTNYEPSPLNRVIEQGAPGDPWQLTSTTGLSATSGHTVRTTYTTNNTNLLTDTGGSTTVALYTVTLNSDQSYNLVQGSGAAGYYGAGQLYVTVSRNENLPTTTRGGTVEEYKDNEGHVVLKRTFNYLPGPPATLQILSTYYVYDNLGNLAFVLPPISNADNTMPSQTVLDNLCYQYRYDLQNRMMQKKLPGKGWEYTVYNQLDQPVLTQDANQRVTNQWTVTKYDSQGRVIMTGLWNAGSVIPQTTLQASIYAAAQWDVRNYSDNVTGYTVSSYPVLSAILTVNYYDNYTNIPGMPTAFVVSGNSAMTRGLLTASKTAVLNTITNTTPDMLWSVHYYDDLGRSTQTFQQHYLGGTLNAANYDHITNTYNFNNQITTATRQHYTALGTAGLKLTVSNRYLYDHMGRKIKTWEQIQNAGQVADTRVLVSQLNYNELGQLMTKNLHSTDSTTFQQSISYTYNERDWLTSSVSDQFALYLYYNTGTAPQYNGNLSNQFWQAKGGAVTIYTYLYDQLNRLTTGNSTAGNNENGITYDLGGNIMSLNRYTGASTTLIDQLSYNYTTTAGNYTNQLQSITDGSSSNIGLASGTFTYAYDANGNMTSDNSKGIGTNGIVYNLLNLPQSITALNTTYTYDAEGQKLRRVITSGTGSSTDYIAGIEYDATASNASTLSFIQTEEGRALPNGTTAYNYEYSLTDHLGDARVNFDTGTGIVRQVQADDYYPFGMDIPGAVVSSPKNYYLYNKKELQANWGLYDYGARFYDPVIARWNVIDPMAENHYNVNPYNYVLNNPLIYYDQYGLDTGKVNPAPAPVHQLKEVTITATRESKSSGFGLAALGIASRVKNVPKWLWVTDTFDQEVPVLDVLTDALTLYYLSKDIKPAIVKSSPAIPDAKDLPWDKGKSPGADWEWKGKGDAETGKGNWVNDKTGQKLHPDFDHPDPKGPHWGLQQPDGEKYDIFPNGNVEPNNK